MGSEQSKLSKIISSEVMYLFPLSSSELDVTKVYQKLSFFNSAIIYYHKI